MNDSCPECGSSNVSVGASVLGCDACGWHHLHKYPCRVCGNPSVTGMGGSAGGGAPFVSLYGCSSHPFTAEEVRQCFRGIAEIVRG